VTQSELLQAGDSPTAHLAKDLRQRHVTMISIGGIIGAGLFVGSSAGIASIGPAVVVSYLLSGIVVLLVLRALSEMAAARPDIGALTEFARLGLGNWAGFLSGWLYWYFWVAVVAVEALAGAKIVHGWLPIAPVWVIALSLLAAMMTTNLMSAKSYGEFEFWFASIKVAAIIAFIVITAGWIFFHPPVTGGRFDNLTAHRGFAPFGPLSVLSGVTSVVFALAGAEIITIAAAESSEPGPALARLTGQVVLRVLLFYVVSIFLIVTILPWTSIHPGDSPFALTLKHIGVPFGDTIMNLIVLTAVLSVLNSGLYVSSRVLFVLSARGDAPKALVVLNKRKVPARAILTAAFFAIVSGAPSALPADLHADGIFKFLVDESGAVMLIVYGLVTLAQIPVRRQFEASGIAMPIRMWLYPWASGATVAAIVAIFIAMGFIPSLRPQLWCCALLTGVAMVAFFVLRARKAPEPAAVRP
jgi:GABA permease